MSTPEAKVKARITARLKARSKLWYDMPVPGGWGKPTIDYVGCYYGCFFGIEAKRPGAVPTSRQEGILEDIVAAGGTTFVISDPAGLRALDDWLDSIEKWRN